MTVRRILTLAAVALAVGAAPAAAWPTPAQQPEYVTLAASNGANDQIPHGMPASWAQYGGSVAAWKNTPCYGQTGPCAYNLTAAYGQLYTPATGNPQPDAKVEICGLQEWLLSPSGAWRAVYDPAVQQIGGALWSEPFSNPVVGTSIDRSIPGCIVIASPPAGFLYHAFYNVARQAVDGAHIAGVAAGARIRFLPGSYSTTGPAPNLIYDTGVDFYNTPTGGSAHSSGEGRFQTVGEQFEWVLYSDLTVSQLHNGPLPPIAYDPAEMHP